MLGALVRFLPFVGSIFNRTMESKDKAAEYMNAETLALRNQVAAEFAKQPTTWWDSFVDGINRLVRPLFTFGTLALFVWAVIDPISFSASMTALALVPENLWLILATIIVFWFGGKTLEGIKSQSVSAEKVAAVVHSMKTIQSLEKAQEDPFTPAQRADQNRREAEKSESGKRLTEEEYQTEMADTSKPLSLPAIEEWNRRRQASKHQNK